MENDNQSTDEAPQQTELEAIRLRATTMGITYHHLSGVDKIQEQIDKHLDSQDNTAPPATFDGPDITDPVDVTPTPVKKVNPNVAAKNRAMEMIRIRATNMNPAKKEWEGEIITAGNGVVGSVRKYVHFNAEWHVPRIILNVLQDRKCQIFRQEKIPGSIKTKRVGALQNEFAIEILPQLTQEELNDLAQRQAMASGTQV